MAVALVVGGVEGGEEGVGRERIDGNRELVGLAGVAHLEEGLHCEACEREAFGFEFFAASLFQFVACSRQHP